MADRDKEHNSNSGKRFLWETCKYRVETNEIKTKYNLYIWRHCKKSRFLPQCPWALAVLGGLCSSCLTEGSEGVRAPGWGAEQSRGPLVKPPLGWGSAQGGRFSGSPQVAVWSPLWWWGVWWLVRLRNVNVGQILVLETTWACSTCEMIRCSSSLGAREPV